MNNFEKKFGKYAINNLSLYLIVCYIIGYAIRFINPMLLNYLGLDPYWIIKGQVWRVVTWVLIPPTTNDLFWVAIMMLFYYNVGRTLESVWGTYRYNVYMFSGMIYTIVGSFVIFGMLYMLTGNLDSCEGLGAFFTTYYINMSIFLAYAATFPDMQVLLMFIIPVKVKYLGIIYAVMLVADCFEIISQGYLIAGIVQFGVILCSLLNFIVFFISNRRGIALNKSQKIARARFRAQTMVARPVTKHKCAICGQTEESNPNLEFRFCSKCNGNYEYCQEHLFTHKHVE